MYRCFRQRDKRGLSYINKDCKRHPKGQNQNLPFGVFDYHKLMSYWAFY